MLSATHPTSSVAFTSSPLSTNQSGDRDDSDAMIPIPLPGSFNGHVRSISRASSCAQKQQQPSPEHELSGLSISFFPLNPTSISNALLPTSYYSVLDELPASLNFSLGGSASSSLAEPVTSNRNGLASPTHQRAHNGSLLTAAAAAHSRSQIQAASN